MARNLFAEETIQSSEEAENPVGRNIFAGESQKELSSTPIGDVFAKDPTIGAAENILSFATGAIAEPLAGWAGIVQSINPWASEGAGAKAVESVKDTLTYDPKTDIAKDQAAGFGSALQKVLSVANFPISGLAGLTELLTGQGVDQAANTIESVQQKGLGDTAGARVYEETGSPLAATIAGTTPTALLEIAGVKGAGKLKAGEVQRPVEVVKKADSELPKFDGTDIRATSGELTQDTAQLKKEAYLLEQTVNDAGDEMRNYKLAQSEEIKKYLEGITDAEANEIGSTLKSALNLRKSSVKYKRKLAYDKLAEVTKDQNVQLNTEVMAMALPDKGDVRDFAATNPGQFKALSGLMTEFGIDLTPASVEAAKKAGIEITPLSVANAERMRKRLNAIEKSDQTGQAARFTGPLKEALDGEFDLASKALEVSGNESVAKAAKEARLSHAALKTEFDEAGMVSALISDKSRLSNIPKIEESQVYQKLAAKSTPVEQVKAVVKSLDRAGSKGRLAKSQLKAGIVLDLLDDAFKAKSRKVKGERIFGANAFASRFDTLEPKIKAIMSEEEFLKLKKMRDISEKLIPPSAAMPKGSAGFFIDNLDRIGAMALLNKIPGAGPIMSNELRALGAAAKDKETLKKAMKNPKTNELYNLLNSDYPVLFSALGLSQIEVENEDQNQNQ